MKKANIFDEKVKRLCDVAQGKIPDRVPVTALVETSTHCHMPMYRSQKHRKTF